MKKIVSAFIAMVMVASTFATSVFAENTLNVSLTNNATAALKAGDKVMVTVKLDGTPFNSFELDLNYDAEIFAYDRGGKATASTLSTAPTCNNASAGVVKATFGVANDQPLEPEDPDTGDIIAANHTFWVRFIVKENVPSGTYEFSVSQNDEQKRATKNEAGELVVFSVGEATSVSVEGITVEDKTPYAIDKEAKSNKDKVAEGEKYTQGFKATVTPNQDVVKKVVATLTSNGIDHPVEWEAPFQGDTPYTFAINVINVPYTAEVTAVWNVTVE